MSTRSFIREPDIESEELSEVERNSSVSDQREGDEKFSSADFI